MEIVVCKNCGTKNRIDPHQAEKKQPACGQCGNMIDLTSAGVDTNKPLYVTDATFARDVLGRGARVSIVDAPLGAVVSGVSNAMQTALTIRSGMTIH